MAKKMHIYTLEEIKEAHFSTTRGYGCIFLKIKIGGNTYVLPLERDECNKAALLRIFKEIGLNGRQLPAAKWRQILPEV